VRTGILVCLLPPVRITDVKHVVDHLKRYRNLSSISVKSIRNDHGPVHIVSGHLMVTRSLLTKSETS